MRWPMPDISHASSIPSGLRDFSKAISPIKNDRIGRLPHPRHFAATVAVEPIERDKVRERWTRW